MIRIAVVGASGRMGAVLCKAAVQDDHTSLAVVVCRAGNAAIGRDAGDLAGTGALDIKIIDDLRSAIDQFDVLVDFTRPDVSMEYIALCRQAGKKIVIGTTGYTAAQRAVITEAAKDDGKSNGRLCRH